MTMPAVGDTAHASSSRRRSNASLDSQGPELDSDHDGHSDEGLHEEQRMWFQAVVDGKMSLGAWYKEVHVLILKWAHNLDAYYQGHAKEVSLSREGRLIRF